MFATPIFSLGEAAPPPPRIDASEADKQHPCNTRLEVRTFFVVCGFFACQNPQSKIVPRVLRRHGYLLLVGEGALCHPPH